MIWIALIVLVLFIAVMGYTRTRRLGGGEAGDDPGSLHHGHHGHSSPGNGHHGHSGHSSPGAGHHGGGGGFSGGGHHG